MAGTNGCACVRSAKKYSSAFGETGLIVSMMRRPPGRSFAAASPKRRTMLAGGRCSTNLNRRHRAKRAVNDRRQGVEGISLFNLQALAQRERNHV